MRPPSGEKRKWREKPLERSIEERLGGKRGGKGCPSSNGNVDSELRVDLGRLLRNSGTHLKVSLFQDSRYVLWYEALVNPWIGFMP